MIYCLHVDIDYNKYNVHTFLQRPNHTTYIEYKIYDTSFGFQNT
jgi:hypothetical protein